jgi:hypothetical protein
VTIGIAAGTISTVAETSLVGSKIGGSLVSIGSAGSLSSSGTRIVVSSLIGGEAGLMMD